MGADNEVLLVNITTIYPRIPYDKSCILNPKDHPFLKHPSYVKYSKARIIRVDVIKNGLLANTFKPQDMIDEEVFKRIIEGFRVSSYVSPKILRFLEEDQNAEE